LAKILNSKPNKLLDKNDFLVDFNTAAIGNSQSIAYD